MVIVPLLPFPENGNHYAICLLIPGNPKMELTTIYLNRKTYKLYYYRNKVFLPLVFLSWEYLEPFYKHLLTDTTAYTVLKHLPIIEALECYVCVAYGNLAPQNLLNIK